MRLKAKLRHHRRGPGNVDPESIQLERTDLTSLFAQLKQLQQVAGVAEPNATIISISETADTWDDLAFDPVLTEADISTFNSEPPRLATHSTPNISNDIGPVPIEDQVILMEIQVMHIEISKLGIVSQWPASNYIIFGT